MSMQCLSCSFYEYDEDFDEYYCRVDLDQDEAGRFISGRVDGCPYYSFNEEYRLAGKQ